METTTKTVKDVELSLDKACFGLDEIVEFFHDKSPSLSERARVLRSKLSELDADIEQELYINEHGYAY